MNSVQRAWRCVVRKPIKSLLLLFVIAAISLFILCGIACRNASVQTPAQKPPTGGGGVGAPPRRVFECERRKTKTVRRQKSAYSPGRAAFVRQEQEVLRNRRGTALHARHARRGWNAARLARGVRRAVYGQRRRGVRDRHE